MQEFYYGLDPQDKLNKNEAAASGAIVILSLRQ